MTSLKDAEGRRVSAGTVIRFPFMLCARCHFVRAVQPALRRLLMERRIIDHVPSERPRLLPELLLGRIELRFV